MSEMEASHFCVKCQTDTLHLFSGSGKKGHCCSCGNALPEAERADKKRGLSYSE